MYPKGHAMKANRPALISLAPSPHYHQISQACGGWGERVEDVNDLPKAIDRALSVVRTEKRQALLSVACGGGAHEGGGDNVIMSPIVSAVSASPVALHTGWLIAGVASAIVNNSLECRALNRGGWPNE